MKFYSKLAFVSIEYLLSQSLPKFPFLHIHLNVFPTGTHLLLFLHWFGLHAFSENMYYVQNVILEFMNIQDMGYTSKITLHIIIHKTWTSIVT